MIPTASRASRLHRTASVDAHSTASRSLVGSDADAVLPGGGKSLLRADALKPVGQRRRATKPRPKQRRQYKATLRAGELACTRGAWVVTSDKEGNASEPAWDPERRLYANVDDMLIVCGDDVAAVRVLEVLASGWTGERWRVEVVYGTCRDGSVLVMRGGSRPKRRKPRKAPRRESVAKTVARRSAELRESK